MPNKANVFFWVSGSNQPGAADVTQLMQLEPSRIIMQSTDDPSAPFGIKEIPVWHLASPLREVAPVNEYIDALLNILQDHAEAMHTVAKQFEAGIHCQLYLYPDTPGLPTIELWKPVVNKLAEFQLSITFDLFLE